MVIKNAAGVVAQNNNSSTLEVKVGVSGVRGQPRLPKTLSEEMESHPVINICTHIFVKTYAHSFLGQNTRSELLRCVVGFSFNLKENIKLFP